MNLLQMVLVLLSLAGQDSPAVTGKPVVTHVAMAAPDVIAVSIRAQSVERGKQVGFRPDDPVKLAFLSCWMGSGGYLAYPACLSFGIVDDETGDVVFSGNALY